jgi:hypothetical protein
VVGAATVLAAFVAVQRGAIEPQSNVSLVLNSVGSALLAGLALAGHQWGFLLLEASWAGISVAGFRARVHRTPSAPE